MNKQDSLRWSNEKHDDIDAMSVKQLKNALKTFGVTSYNGMLEKQDFRNRLRSFISPTATSKKKEEDKKISYSKGMTVYYTKEENTDTVQIMKVHLADNSLSVIITDSYEKKRVGLELDINMLSGRISLNR